MGDTPDSKSGSARSVGSSPTLGTIFLDFYEVTIAYIKAALEDAYQAGKKEKKKKKK